MPLIQLLRAVHLPIPTFIAPLLLITFALSAELREKHVFPRYAEMQQARTECASALKVRDFDKALLHGQKALALGHEILTDDDATLADLYNALGSAWEAKDESNKAIKIYEMALALDLRKLSADHPSVTYLYNNLGALWEMKGQCDKAAANYEKGMRYHRETDVPFKTNCYQK